MAKKAGQKEKILMVFVLYATFAKRDVRILEKEFSVDNYHFNTANKFNLPLAFIKQFVFLIFNIRKYKVIVTQSAGYLSFWPVVLGRLFNVPVVIIAIGTDCARLPEIQYGSHDKTIIAWFTRFSFNRATLILPVHKSLTESTYTYLDVKYPNQGIKAFCNNIRTPIVEMVNGYDTAKWLITNKDRPSKTFLTVTFAMDQVGYYRKGIDVLLEAAEQFPDYQFTIVGKVYLSKPCPNNVNLIDNVPQEELLKIYNSHLYYLQLSMFEGFPNALCEAMLCGCIPIGSDVAAIPDIIGNKGYILKRKDSESIRNLFGNIDKQIEPEEVRNRIANNFPFQRREREFLELMSTL